MTRDIARLTQKLSFATASSDGSNDRKLALQLKHDLRFTQSDETFARVISDCWSVFTSAMGWPFNPESDRIGIGLGLYQTKLDAHFRPLLEWARTENDAVNFFQKVEISNFSSVEKRDYLALVRDLLTAGNKRAVSDEDLWRFLRCLVVIPFDLEQAGSRDTTYCWNALLGLLNTPDESQARSLLDSLCAIVARHNRTAGFLDLSAIRSELSTDVPLKDQPRFGNDLKCLRHHSETTLANITQTIGGRVHLPRTETIDHITEKVRQKEILVIAGEPMIGKSGLLKLLATRLQFEGAVFAFSVEEFGNARTLENFLHNNGVTHTFPELLAAVGDATLRCILIDGLERATEENKRRVINDILLALRQHNDALRARRAPADYHWHAVFTCRNQEMEDILLNLKTREKIQEGSLSILPVKALTDKEITEVVAHLPRLHDLADSGRLKDLLSRPGVLDILTLPDLTLPATSLPTRLTETWLLVWFWRQVVRLGEGARTGRGHPDNREQLLIELGLQNLRSDGVVQSTVRDVEALSGLISDRLLRRSDGVIRFYHDALEDWSVSISLYRAFTNIEVYLAKIGEPLRGSRSFQLATLRLLEVDQDTEAWVRLLSRLNAADAISPRWRTLALSALLESDLISDMLPKLENHLLQNDNALLCQLLKTLRMIELRPNPALELLGNVKDQHFKSYLTYWNVPIWERWIPIIHFALAHQGQLGNRAVLEFSFVARRWMEMAQEGQVLREEIARYAMDTVPRFMVRTAWNERDNMGLSYDQEQSVRNNLALCALYGADCASDNITRFVRQYGLRSADSDQYDLESVILRQEYGWVPLCKYLPDVAVDILEAIMCVKAEPDDYRDYHYLFMTLGIADLSQHTPPGPWKGPFRIFLRFHETHALNLIHRVVSHATRIWILREQMEHHRQPIPQILSLPSGNVEVWGDELVYRWYRYPTVGPPSVTCALMALEEWMLEQIKAGTDPKELFDTVLRQTNSVAVVGVCTSVALAHMEQCLEAIVPIIERPAFWDMDITRFAQDQLPENGTRTISTYLSLGRDESDYQKLMEMARQPQRQLDLRSFVLLFLLKAPSQLRDRVQTAIRSFSEQPAIYFEDESENEPLIQSRVSLYGNWAALAERENYETGVLADRSGIAIQFKPPQDPERERYQAHFEAQNRFWGFHNWSISLLDDGNVGETFTFESAMSYAQELLALDKVSKESGDLLSDAESRANAIALFAAGLVLRAWEWVEKNGHVGWCREQLLMAAKRQERAFMGLDETDDAQRFYMGHRRSAARALPVLLSKRPRDREVQNTVIALAINSREEVRGYLFSALSTLWGVQDHFIWKCIDRLILQARKKASHDREHRLEYDRYDTGRWRKFQSIQKIQLRLSRLARRILSYIEIKPIREATYEDIAVRQLQSVVYAIPSGERIVVWGSSHEFDFLCDLVSFTINNFMHFQEEDKYNKWAHNEWNQVFFPKLANALLRLPHKHVEVLLEPILDHWEQVPSMMENLLRYLSLTGTQVNLENRLINLWLPLGNIIIDSECVASRSKSGLRDIHEILGLLIFADPTGIVKWEVDEWAPIHKMTGLIERWVARVGHDPDCFPSLLRLLRGIGFCLVPEFGINWLHQCLSRLNDHNAFYRQSHTDGRLAELLWETWIQHSQVISRDSQRFGQFVYLVDRVAKQGEPLAVRLQKQLLGL